MKANKNVETDLGFNIKCLMRTFQITQAQLAEKLGLQGGQLCNLLQKAYIDDEMLQKIADAIGNGVTMDMIKNYKHEDTISYIINNYTQNVESGGSGTGNFNNDHSSTFEGGSQPTITHNYIAEQAFAFAEKNTKLEKLLLYYRMKLEPEAIEKEIDSLKKELNTTIIP